MYGQIASVWSFLGGFKKFFLEVFRIDIFVHTEKENWDTWTLELLTPHTISRRFFLNT